MYRLLVESLLGLHREGDRLSFAPCVPDDWERWSADWRHGGSRYRVEFVRKPGDTGVAGVSVDGVLQPACAIELVDDGRVHDVLVRFGRPEHSRHRDTAAAMQEENPSSHP
jgi:cellobiose phosphorylase